MMGAHRAEPFTAMNRFVSTLAAFSILPAIAGADEAVTRVSSLRDLAKAAAGNNRTITMEPGVYRMTDYLTEPVLEAIRAGVDRSLPRPPVPMFVFRGDSNRINLTGVTVEIDTTLYQKVPQGGYTRCLIVAGKGNRIDGLSIRNTGPEDRGSNGNILSVAGDDNTLENITLSVCGSYPFGYGDLLGKGGPGLVPLQKQSGIQVLGNRSVLRHCKVSSRAFGHCFYIQEGGDIRIEDCHAEGVTRGTTEMLRDKSGPAFDNGFRSVYLNRDGFYQIVGGYTKSLTEDGFRTYGSAGTVTLVGCTATNTRAGFEIGNKDDSPKKTLVENCAARGCERAFLLGSNVIVRRSSGDITHGPLLYLRGGRNSEIELELAAGAPVSTVHALATIAGTGHRVTLHGPGAADAGPGLPILLGYGMPDHGEMSSPIRPAEAREIQLTNNLAEVTVVTGELATGCAVRSADPKRSITGPDLQTPPKGKW